MPIFDEKPAAKSLIVVKLHLPVGLSSQTNFFQSWKMFIIGSGELERITPEVLINGPTGGSTGFFPLR